MLSLGIIEVPASSAGLTVVPRKWRESAGPEHEGRRLTLDYVSPGILLYSHITLRGQAWHGVSALTPVCSGDDNISADAPCRRSLRCGD